MSTYDTGTFDSGTFDNPGELGGLGDTPSQIVAELTQARSCQMNEAAGGGTGFRDGETTWISHRRHVNTTLRDVAAFRFKITLDVGSADSIDAGEFLYYWAGANQDAACSVVVVACDDPIGPAATNSPKDLYDSYAGSSAIAHTSIDNNTTNVANTVDGADLNTMLGEALDNATWTGTEKYIAVVMQGDQGSPANAQTQGGVSSPNPATLTFNANVAVPPTEESGNAPIASAAPQHPNNWIGFIHRPGFNYHDGYGDPSDRTYERWDPVASPSFFKNECWMHSPGGGYGQNLGSSVQHREFAFEQGQSFIEIRYKLTGKYNGWEFDTDKNTAANWPEPIQDWLCAWGHLQTLTETGTENGFWVSGHSAGSHLTAVGSMVLNDDGYYTRTYSDNGVRRSTVYNSEMAPDQWGFTQDSPHRMGLPSPLGVVQWAGVTNLWKIYRDTDTLAETVRSEIRDAMEALAGGYRGGLAGKLQDEYTAGDYLNGEMEMSDIIFGGPNDLSVYNRPWKLAEDGSKLKDGRHFPKAPILHIQAGGQAWWNKAVIGGPDNYEPRYEGGRGDNVVGRDQFSSIVEKFSEEGYTLTEAGFPIECKDGFGGNWTGEITLDEPFSHIYYDSTGVDIYGHDNCYKTSKSGGLWSPRGGQNANGTTLSPIQDFMDQVRSGSNTVGVMGQMEPAVAAAGHSGNIASAPVFLPGTLVTVSQVTHTKFYIRGQLALPTAEIWAYTSTAGPLELVNDGPEPPDPLPPYSGDGPNNPTAPVLPVMPVVS